jgi:hypothetical protein
MKKDKQATPSASQTVAIPLGDDTRKQLVAHAATLGLSTAALGRLMIRHCIKQMDAGELEFVPAKIETASR